METLIELRQLSRRYPAGTDSVAALDGADFSVARGELVALMGPSGSGKSTLLNLVGALDRPTGGDVRVDGLSLANASEPQRVWHRRERVGFIFQSFNLLPTLTALENVESPMVFAEVRPSERRVRALALLESVGLGHRASHRPGQLSGGERQRVAIARALANGPGLLLADEPTGNLDSRSGAAVLDMLCDRVRRDQLTLLLVTHDPAVAARADRVIHLHDGRVWRMETRGEFAERLKAGGLA
ncbi:MAG: ABC transporter ATP-binding protein [Verrucomicrobiota bacterium]